MTPEESFEKNVGDDKSFPNHTDIDIWLSKKDMADKKYTEEDMCAFIEFTRNNYTGFGLPHLVYNKGRQEKTKQIFERFIQSLNKQD